MASVLLLASASAATLVAASPAAAAITGRIVISRNTPTDNAIIKQITVGCPNGMTALGGGAVIVGGNGVVHLTANMPTLTTQSHTARAAEFPGFRDGVWAAATPWRLTSHVICANGVTGRTVVNAFNPIVSPELEGSVSVSCPAGKQVVGMGGWVSGQYILSSVYAPTSTSVIVKWGRPVTAFDPGHRPGVEAWAVCVDPVPGLESVIVSSPWNSDNAKGLLVTCPSGKKLYDVGGGVSGSLLRQVKVETLTPGTINAIVIASEMVYGTPSNWGMFAQGICAP